MSDTKLNYLDKHGLGTLVKLIKKAQTDVYRVKGRGIYADAAYVEHAQAGDPGYITAITSVGLWQLTDGTWSKIDTFDVADVGDVYDIENAFVTDATFREGADHQVNEGMNIVLVNIGTKDAPVFKWDLLPGLLNLDEYQTKKLVNATGIEVFVNETPTVYTSAASLPGTEAAATATIDDLMVAIMGEGDEKGDVYRAHVSQNPADPTQNDIVWVKLGNQLTVEGMLEFLGHTCPNTPITDEEIEDIWNNN